MTPDEELKLILGRLEKAGRGMLLFHDNRPWTADDDAGLSRRAEEARLSRRPHRSPAPATARRSTRRPAGVSETERTIGALKPRLDKGAAARTPPGPIPVKPAPSE